MKKGARLSTTHILKLIARGGLATAATLLLWGTPLLAAPSNDDTFDQNKFFCTTRYGLSIEGEAARRDARQKGYDGEECPDGSGDDEKGLARACKEGQLAYKDLLPEPEATANGVPTVATPEPPRLQSQSGSQSCAGVDTAFLSCQVPAALGLQGTGLGALLVIVINILAAGVGIAAIGAFVYAGVLYSSAGGNESQVKKAKDLIKNTVIGIVLFIALYGVIEFIVPGGVF